MKYFLATVFLGLMITIPCQAGIFAKPCSQCGCCQLKRVCRLVPDVKKVTEVKYTVDEEEFCLFGKSGCEKVIVQDECDPNCQRCETVQVPQCDQVRCRKKLKKTSTTVEKPSYKCIVDTVCCQCGCVCNSSGCVQ